MILHTCVHSSSCKEWPDYCTQLLDALPAVHDGIVYYDTGDTRR